MLYIDVQYILRLRLDRFRDHGSYKYSFRCPVCGDSQKSTHKKRGGAYPSPDHDTLIIHCFNCGYTANFYSFIRDYFPEMFSFYRADLQKEKNINIQQKEKLKVPLPEKKQKLSTNSDLIVDDLLIPIRNMKDSIPYRYLQKRCIPNHFFDVIYYSDNYAQYINKNYIKNKYYVGKSDKRIVFPIYDINKKLIGFQGRTLNYKSDIRFLTTKIVDDAKLIYGLNNIDPRKNVYVTEGIFDSLMMPNCIAMLRLDVDIKYIQSLFASSKIIFIFDNELRNPDVMKSYTKIADIPKLGLFIWPDYLSDIKDLNELVQKYEIDDIEELICSYTLYGCLEKKLALTKIF